MSSTTPLATQLLANLQTHNLPPPSQTWLQTLIATRNPPPPLPSLLMTAKTRLLASDLTSPGLLDGAKIPTICFVDGIATPTAKEMRLTSDVFTQVVDIENFSRSRWEQVEELEAVERGEQTRGREVVRLPIGAGPEGDDPTPTTRQVTTTPATSAAAKNATHRLLLQDPQGQRVYALELVRIPEIAIGSLQMGAKILLKKGTVVARGTILLEPQTCQMLGGKVEAWQKTWLDGRLARLREVARAGCDD